MKLNTFFKKSFNLKDNYLFMHECISQKISEKQSCEFSTSYLTMYMQIEYNSLKKWRKKCIFFFQISLCCAIKCGTIRCYFTYLAELWPKSRPHKRTDVSWWWCRDICCWKHWRKKFIIIRKEEGGRWGKKTREMIWY